MNVTDPPFYWTHFQDNLGKPAPDDGMAVASAGPYANHLDLTPDR